MRIRFTLLVFVIASSISIVSAEDQGQDQKARVQQVREIMQQQRRAKQGEASAADPDEAKPAPFAETAKLHITSLRRRYMMLAEQSRQLTFRWITKA